MYKIIIIVLIIVSIDVNAELRTIKSTGISMNNTCQSLLTKAENYCKQSNSVPNLDTDIIRDCTSNCQQIGTEVNCSLSYSCDSTRKPEKKSIKLSASGMFRNPMGRDSVCRSAKKKARVKVKEQCKDFANADSISGLLSDRSYNNEECNCESITFIPDPSAEAYKCSVQYFATCTKK